MVCDSSGKPRADTGGGATRRLFMQLPGVGAKTAKIWYDLGYRCVDSVLSQSFLSPFLSPFLSLFSVLSQF